MAAFDRQACLQGFTATVARGTEGVSDAVLARTAAGLLAERRLPRPELVRILAMVLSAPQLPDAPAAPAPRRRPALPPLEFSPFPMPPSVADGNAVSIGVTD